MKAGLKNSKGEKNLKGHLTNTPAGYILVKTDIPRRGILNFDSLSSKADKICCNHKYIESK